MNILASMWKYRCPKCRKGDLFVKPFNFRKPLNMHKRCSYCDQSTEPEPGFYYGAMFISYVIGGFLFLGVGLTLSMYYKVDVNTSILIVCVMGALIFYWLLRFSRSVWIHMTVKYNPETIEKKRD